MFFGLTFFNLFNFHYLLIADRNLWAGSPLSDVHKTLKVGHNFKMDMRRTTDALKWSIDTWEALDVTANYDLAKINS